MYADEEFGAPARCPAPAASTCCCALVVLTGHAGVVLIVAGKRAGIHFVRDYDPGDVPHSAWGKYHCRGHGCSAYAYGVIFTIACAAICLIATRRFG